MAQAGLERARGRAARVIVEEAAGRIAFTWQGAPLPHQHACNGKAAGVSGR